MVALVEAGRSRSRGHRSPRDLADGAERLAMGCLQRSRSSAHRGRRAANDALATVTGAGPFFARTHKPGTSSVWRDGELVAMAGERMKPMASPS
jgi:hypothetical protein